MTPAQCRAARALLDWSQTTLSGASGVGIATVRQFEAGSGAARNATVETLMNTLDRAGVEFIAGGGAGPGVRLKDTAGSASDFLAFLKYYERVRLRYKGRHVGGTIPEFGFAFVYHNRDGADLFYKGTWLGKVHWRDGNISFDPPLPNTATSALSEEIFDQWIGRADARAVAGI